MSPTTKLIGGSPGSIGKRVLSRKRRLIGLLGCCLALALAAPATGWSKPTVDCSVFSPSGQVACENTGLSAYQAAIESVDAGVRGDYASYLPFPAMLDSSIPTEGWRMAGTPS